MSEATNGGKRRADTEAMRAKAAVMFADGARLADVARELSITTRRARSLKASVAPTIKAAAEATLASIAEGGGDVRARVASKADEMADVLVDAARGRLRAVTDDGDDGLIERDASMVNARVRAALGLLGFVIGQKVDATVRSDLTPETAALVVAIAMSEKEGG